MITQELYSHSLSHFFAIKNSKLKKKTLAHIQTGMYRQEHDNIKILYRVP